MREIVTAEDEESGQVDILKARSGFECKPRSDSRAAKVSRAHKRMQAAASGTG